jgi:putative FmdB family regulatory protein
MPIYEYQCGGCGHQLEVMQKFSDEPLKACPECHQPSLNKLISSTSFQLKGTGWYVTDTRDKGKPKPADTAETATKKSSDSTSTNDKKSES